MEASDSTEVEKSQETKEQEAAKVPVPEFTLMDQNGVEHAISDYKGKTVFLNFWATWCPPCRAELPDIQKLYEDYGGNEAELVVLGIAGPGLGQEGDADHVKDFLSENGYTFPVLMDEGGGLFGTFGISSFPTTFMIDTDGNVFGHVIGGMTAEMMENVVQ